MGSTSGFAQGTVNATVGGTVADASGARIPGVSVSATNIGTGIVNNTVSNESGAYNFASLQPGTYKLSAELPGFQTRTFTDVQLGGAQQVRLNFVLEVAAAAGTNVEVTVAADTILATSSNSIGTVLPEYKVRDLPTVASNVTIGTSRGLCSLSITHIRSPATARTNFHWARAIFCWATLPAGCSTLSANGSWVES